MKNLSDGINDIFGSDVTSMKCINEIIDTIFQNGDISDDEFDEIYEKHFSTNESYSDHNKTTAFDMLESEVIDTLDYLDEYQFDFPYRKFLADGWADWKYEVELGENEGRLIEDADCLIEYIEPYINKSDDDIENTELIGKYNRLKKLRGRLSAIVNGDGFVKQELRPITEANLARVSKGHEKDGYAIISASRAHRSQSENDAETNKLKNRLRDSHYSYIMVYGGYKENGQDRAFMEKSFVVFPYDISNNSPKDFGKFEKDMVEFATPYDDPDENQDSILLCRPGGHPFYLNLRGDEDGNPFDDVEYNNIDNEYFTALKKWNDMSLNRKGRDWNNGKPQRYTLKYATECYMEMPPSSMQIGHQRWASGDMNNIYGETLTENSNRYRNLNKGLFGDPSGKIRTWAIISPQNPLGWKDSDEPDFISKYLEWTVNKSKYNSDAVKQLETTELLHHIEKTGDAALKYSGAKYVPLKGSYGDKEKSYMIFNITLADAKVIARDYGQESFFFGRVSSDGVKIAYYETTNACKSYHLVEISKTITDESDADDYFSKFGRKFKINMKTFGDDVPDVENQGEFEESFDENRTFMSRAMHRRDAYKK